MAKFHIDYTDKSGDLSHVWVEAGSPEEAEDIAREEYWDIEEIIQIY